MKAFVTLFRELDEATSTRRKVQSLVTYFSACRKRPQDAAWAIHYLMGRRQRRTLSRTQLLGWLAEETRLPLWMIEECYAHVGDLAETIALLVGQARDPVMAESAEAESAVADRPAEPPLTLLPESLTAWSEALQGLVGQDVARVREVVQSWWRGLPAEQLFLVHKLLLGGFRVGVSRQLLARALSEFTGLEIAEIQQRLMGDWHPSAGFFEQLVSPTTPSAQGDARPCPFYLSSPLLDPPESLGERSQWLAEWKWDGIRLQIVRQRQGVSLWSRGEELLDEAFPDVVAAAMALPAGVVLDGELLAWAGDQPAPFQALQRRLGRRRPGARTLAACPVRVLAFDLLQQEGADCRHWPLHRRRKALLGLLESLNHAGTELAGAPRILPAPALDGDWSDLHRQRAQARRLGVEGLMLKRLDSPYRVGRVRGDWWKWKVDPFTVDAVLIYAQAGHGRRANLFTDYTFAVWAGEALVPVARAYSGLDQAEIEELDRWIRRHTRERFGPVRSVEPVQVFELAFEGVTESARHKAGLALRFPRIHRWRRDLSAGQANSLGQLQELLHE